MWSSTNNCLLGREGHGQPGHPHRRTGVFIGRNTILSCKNGDIELADGANIGFNCELFSASRVTIGPRRAHGRLQLRDSAAINDFLGSKPRRCSRRRGPSVGVSIGDGAWLGAGAKILDGVQIGGARGHRRRRCSARGCPPAACDRGRRPQPASSRPAKT